MEQSPKLFEQIPTSNALKKFNQYVSYYNIQIEQFWKSNTINATSEEFVHFLSDIGNIKFKHIKVTKSHKMMLIKF